jgi:hypothetical protein
MRTGDDASVYLSRDLAKRSRDVLANVTSSFSFPLIPAERVSNCIDHHELSSEVAGRLKHLRKKARSRVHAGSEVHQNVVVAEAW